jgi:hypothetical protein
LFFSKIKYEWSANMRKLLLLPFCFLMMGCSMKGLLYNDTGGGSSSCAAEQARIADLEKRFDALDRKVDKLEAPAPKSPQRAPSKVSPAERGE